MPAEINTTKLNDGTVVVAHADGYAWCGANRTMALRKAEKVREAGLNVDVHQPFMGRVHYVRVLPETPKPKPPEDCLLRCTAKYGAELETEGETLTMGKAEFAGENADDLDDPAFQRVLELQPGETTMLDLGAGGAWEIRCVTMDEGMAELDREQTVGAGS